MKQSKTDLKERMWLPYALAVKVKHLMYVTNEIRRQVMVFTTKGQYFGSFGCKGEFDPFALTRQQNRDHVPV